MPGDTKIKRTANGWIDIDVPTYAYGARWQARNARRTRLANPSSTLPTQVTSIPRIPSATTRTGLQQRLYDRLIYQQGATTSEADHVIENFGYNAAASYGHMRAAGAKDAEALYVIALASPGVSVAYGTMRANGYDHTQALSSALMHDALQDSDDDD